MGISSAAPGTEPFQPVAASAESYDIATSPRPGADASLDALGGKGGGKGVMRCFGCDGEDTLRGCALVSLEML